MLRSLLTLVVFCAGLGLAQTSTGTITGRVVDASGQYVPKAEVRLINQDTHDTRLEYSGETGEFLFTSVQTGKYTVAVKAAGFKQLDKKDLELSSSERLAAGDLRLEVGSVSESVEVKADAATVQTISSEKSALLDSTQITNLMSRGRDLMALLIILPGVVNDGEGSDSLGVFNSPSAMSGVTGDHNAMNIDGISGNTRSGTHLDTPVNMDAVSEVKVLTNNYQAEYGKGGASVINVITKSGTRDFHGGAYYFIRNEDFNANTFFNNRGQPYVARQRYRYNTIGSNVGGPIYIPNHFNTAKDKLFFFFSQEYLPIQSPNSPRNYTVPTALERNGDFSQTLDVNNKLITIKDPLNNSAAFPGNVIPANRIDPNMQKLMSIFPLPNSTNRALTKGNYNFSIADSENKPVSQEILRVDDYVSSKFRFYFRGMDMRNHNQGLNSTTNALTWGIGPVDYTTSGPNLGGTATYIITPTLINEFTFGYALWTEQQTFDSATYLPQVERNKLGIDLGQFYPANNPLDLIPAMSFGGVPNAAATSFTARFPMADDASTWTLSDGVSKVWKQHLFKVGIQAERVIYDQFHTGAGNFAGAFNFGQSSSNPVDTGYAYSNAMMGFFQTYTESTNRTDYRPVTPILEWYVQDTWHVAPRLTLDLGVRFTAGWPQYPDNNAAANFVPSLYNSAKAPVLYAPAFNSAKQKVAINPLTGALLPSAYAGLIVPGSGDMANGVAVAGVTPNWPRGMVDFQGILPAPRLGFAWDMLGNGKMALRGGFGVNYNSREGGGTLGDLSANPPLIYNPAIYYGSTSTFLSTAGTNGVSSFGRTLQRNQQPPASYAWSLGVQRDVGFGTLLDVSYVGNVGRHIQQAENINEVPYGSRALAQNQDPTNAGKPLSDNYFRPYMGWGTITSDQYRGNSSYNSLQAMAKRRFSKGLTFGVSWTWSKAMDDGINVATYLPNRPWNYEESTYDRTHVFSAYYLWDVPKASRVWHNGMVKRALDNWQVSGITRFVTGAPLNMGFLGTGNLTSGADLTQGGDGWRAVMLSNPNLPKDQRTFDQFFNGSAFTSPIAGLPYGNAAATFGRGPGINNWNLSLFKNFTAIHERVHATFRAEAYNALNHTQFSSVSLSPKFDNTGAQVNAAFGQVSAARDPRYLQFGLRLAF